MDTSFLIKGRQNDLRAVSWPSILMAMSLACVSYEARSHPGDQAMTCTAKQTFTCSTNSQKIADSESPSCLDWGGAAHTFEIIRVKESPLTYEVPAWFGQNRTLRLRSTDTKKRKHWRDRHFVSENSPKSPNLHQEPTFLAMMSVTGHPHTLTLIDAVDGPTTTINTRFAFCVEE